MLPRQQLSENFGVLTCPGLGTQSLKAGLKRVQGCSELLFREVFPHVSNPENPVLQKIEASANKNAVDRFHMIKPCFKVHSRRQKHCRHRIRLMIQGLKLKAELYQARQHSVCIQFQEMRG